MHGDLCRARRWRPSPGHAPDISHAGSGPCVRTDRAYAIALLLAVAALPTAVTLVYEWTTGVTPSNAIRALAGAPLGAAVVLVIVAASRDARDLSGGPLPVRRKVN